MSFSQTSKAGLMFFIFLHMPSHQSLFPFSSSNAFDSCTDFGILTLKLCAWTQYFDLRFPMMRLRFASTFRIHHVNDGLPAIRQCTAYLAIYIRYEFFIFLRVTHAVLPSFHWKRNSTPFFFSLQRFFPVSVVMNASCYFTSVPSYLCLTIFWNRKCWFLSPFFGYDYLSHNHWYHGFCYLLRIREGMGNI